jgi:transposase-like protein
MISFSGRHFPKDIILMSIRWYLSYSLSYREIEELLQERNIKIDHATLQRWVVKYSPQLLAEFNKKKRKINSSWRMDESVLLQAA